MRYIKTYGPNDLKSGKCTSCSEESNEILANDGKCLDCIECINFENLCFLDNELDV